jgi:hypothetical protein
VPQAPSAGAGKPTRALPPRDNARGNGSTPRVRNGVPGGPLTPPRGNDVPPTTPADLDPLGSGSSPFEGGRLGPPPANETGRIRPVSSSALPPDLHWAADDGTVGPTTGPITSPFSGLTSLGGPRPPADTGLTPLGGPRPPADNEVAPHVAAMSPEARAAVQATVGNTGGSAGGRAPAPGDDPAQRGRLINFLSSVR